MANPKNYERDVNGIRFTPGGMNTVLPPDGLPPGKYPYLQNVRAYRQLQIVGRAVEGVPVVTGLPTPVHSLRILNDTTPAGPGAPFYVRIIGAFGSMYVNSTAVGSGYSQNPVSMTAFRPNASVRPWMYIGDSSQAVQINTKFLLDGSSTAFNCFGPTKISSTGQIYKRGIAEPQLPPVVSTQGTTTTGVDSLPSTTIPWTNAGGANSAFNYGQTNGADGTAPVFIPVGVGAQTLTLAVTGTAVVNGTNHNPGDTGPVGASFPTNFTGAGPRIVVGAFTDGSGNVITGTSPVPIAVNVGAGRTLQIPAGAVRFQIGVDSQGNTFTGNAGGGAFTVNWTLVTSAIATKVSTLGDVTAYYWGDSPHSGPVATYIWKNPNDTGSGISRSIGTATGSVTNNSWQLDSSPEDGTVPMLWDTLAEDGTVSGSIPLFSVKLESEGYQDFNMCMVGTLFIPSAGTYNFGFSYKDQILVGIGGGVTAGTPTGNFGTSTHNGQTETVVSALPLVFIGKIDGSGGTQNGSIPITFAGPGSYQIEIDYDYWEHTGRKMVMTVNGAVIPPIAQNVRTEVEYRYVYRSSATGAPSNPSPASAPQVTPVENNTIQAIWSPDPQVDKIDFYRLDSTTDNFTYVATCPNSNPPPLITDGLSDLDIAANPLLDFDNYEPFPSIDLPRKGVINVTGGNITWVSGDQFNTRWLGGTIILIGSPTSLAYALYNRPTSGTQMLIPDVPDGTNILYEIPEPILAAQPVPNTWGPTDNTAYDFAVGDPLRPGTLYFTKGNNPDSAPDTNQIEVTSPSEPLINGVKTAAEAMVWTSERRWLIYPTFTQALSTVEGVEGSVFTAIPATGSRGLYIPKCLCSDGGKTGFFRAKDGIYACEFGGPDEYLCDDIYNLFPREGVVPQPVTIGNFTVWPPDDTQPNAQKLSFGQTVLYYDYLDVNGVARTLVFDLLAKGWSVDAYQAPVTVHAWEEGPNTDTVMVGCTDGAVRLLSGAVVGVPVEAATSVVLTNAQNGGDARASKRIGDVFLRAIVTFGNPLTIGLYQNQYASALSGYSPTFVLGTGLLQPYIIDFSNGFGFDLIDIEMSLSWATQSANVLDLWQPDWIGLPENTQDRPGDWDFMGSQGNKLVRGFILEMDTLGNPKQLALQRAEDQIVFTPNEVPAIVNVQGMKAFTYTPPFVTHSARLYTNDGVQWRVWGVQWVTDPWVEYATFVSAWTNLGVQGAKYIRGLVIPMDTQGAAATIRVVTSDGDSVGFTTTTPPAVKTVVAFAFVPPIIAHDVQVQMLTATAGAWVEEARWDFDAYPEIIPEYTPIMEVSGPDNKFVQGIKLIADTNNTPVTFKILYDGGQNGPTFTGTFNGKQTLIFSWPPFLAHDIQLVPQANARIWWGGTGDGISEWVSKPFPEAATIFQTEMVSNGLIGYQHIRAVDIAYQSTTTVTLTLLFDTFNPIVLTLPSTFGLQKKIWMPVPPNKFKLVSYGLTAPVPFYLWAEDSEVWVKSWGSTGPYNKIRPFGGPSSAGAEV